MLSNACSISQNVQRAILPLSIALSISSTNDESACSVLAPFLKPNCLLLTGFYFNVVSSNSHKISRSNPLNKVCIKEIPLKDFACL